MRHVERLYPVWVTTFRSIVGEKHGITVGNFLQLVQDRFVDTFVAVTQLVDSTGGKMSRAYIVSSGKKPVHAEPGWVTKISIGTDLQLSPPEVLPNFPQHCW
jgi:hypothetical protein